MKPRLFEKKIRNKKELLKKMFYFLVFSLFIIKMQQGNATWGLVLVSSLDPSAMLPDDEFINLIKKMAIKNHNSPCLYKEALAGATTTDAKLKIMITDKFYECVYRNQSKIETKIDLNDYCGYLISFNQ